MLNKALSLLCRLTGKLADGTVFVDHQAEDQLLEFVVGEGEHFSLVSKYMWL